MRIIAHGCSSLAISGVGIFMLVTSSFAGEPVKLNNTQLDSVSAAGVSLRVSAAARSGRGPVSEATTIVAGGSVGDDRVELNYAVGAGVSAACCDDSSSSVSIEQGANSNRSISVGQSTTHRLNFGGSVSLGFGGVGEAVKR